MKQRLMTFGYAAMIFSIVFLFQGSVSTRSARATEAAAELTDLKSLDQLKGAFQRDRGAVRL
jgi:hypothetical protein